jgi:single-strand DNA-binding protein
MSSMSSQIMIAGNLGDDPELRFTPNGAPVCRLSVGVTDRQYDKTTGQYRDVGTTWFTVIAWNQLAENSAATFTRGNRVIVSGLMKSRSWETPEGEKRTTWEITADEIGPSLRYATAEIKRITRSRPGPDDSDAWADTGTSPATEPATEPATAPAQPATDGPAEPATATGRARGRKSTSTATAPA